MPIIWNKERRLMGANFWSAIVPVPKSLGLSCGQIATAQIFLAVPSSKHGSFQDAATIDDN